MYSYCNRKMWTKRERHATLETSETLMRQEIDKDSDAQEATVPRSET